MWSKCSWIPEKSNSIIRGSLRKQEENKTNRPIKYSYLENIFPAWSQNSLNYEKQPFGFVV